MARYRRRRQSSTIQLLARRPAGGIHHDDGAAGAWALEAHRYAEVLRKSQIYEYKKEARELWAPLAARAMVETETGLRAVLEGRLGFDPLHSSARWPDAPTCA